MNAPETETPKKPGRVTDTALIIVAILAIASWLWRRTRKDAEVTDAQPATPPESST